PRPGGSLRAALGLGVVTVYGGFFGGGVNLMVMASLSLMGYKNVQYSNAIKNFLAVMIIASVFVVFLIQGGIAWPQTIVCAFGAITGGFIGGSVAKRMPVAWLRGVVIAVGVVLTVAYTWLYWIKPFLA
uniref:TSUP family transporter n=1 Tax=Propionivibrio sp. TaxID=2212460 RepID=UPI00272DE381